MDTYNIGNILNLYAVREAKTKCHGWTLCAFCGNTGEKQPLCAAIPVSARFFIQNT